MSPFVVGLSGGERSPRPPAFCFESFPITIALVVSAVGMWESRPPFGEICKGLTERGSLLLAFHAFHAFHSPGISTALLSHRVVRLRANRLIFAFCIRRAASVSLIVSACIFGIPAVMPSFKYSDHPIKEVSFSTALQQHQEAIVRKREMWAHSGHGRLTWAKLREREAWHRNQAMLKKHGL